MSQCIHRAAGLVIDQSCCSSLPLVLRPLISIYSLVFPLNLQLVVNLATLDSVQTLQEHHSQMQSKRGLSVQVREQLEPFIDNLSFTRKKRQARGDGF